ncbi:hypothetical protein [Cypionkella psychrotolerans]|uniref:hypothetical protein n=1 Tax=Cypionkella psychrotolerans TaxID=1678131 RepID=UPI000B141FD9
MTPDIFHGVADVVGDSLHLAIKVTEVQVDVFARACRVKLNSPRNPRQRLQGQSLPRVAG